MSSVDGVRSDGLGALAFAKLEGRAPGSNPRRTTIDSSVSDRKICPRTALRLEQSPRTRESRELCLGDWAEFPQTLSLTSLNKVLFFGNCS